MYVLTSECDCKAASIRPPLFEGRESETEKRKERVGATAAGCKVTEGEGGTGRERRFFEVLALIRKG